MYPCLLWHTSCHSKYSSIPGLKICDNIRWMMLVMINMNSTKKNFFLLKECPFFKFYMFIAKVSN